MIGVLAVADYREFESWRRARFAVCAALDFAKSIPRLHGRKNLVDEINRLSVSILDTLSRGLERGGDSAFIEKALEKVNRLDRTLRELADRHGLSSATSHHLQRELKEVRRMLQETSQETKANKP